MKTYQGIGSAVNTHLARFAEADREIAVAREAMDHRTAENLTKLMRLPWGREWGLFGASYGVVGPDGKPEIQLMQVNDQQTIVGRTQRSASGMAAFQGAHLGIREHNMLSKAVSHYVSAEIIHEVTMAAEDLGNEPIHNTDLFTPYGFAILETPIVVFDLEGDTGVVSETQTIHIRAFGWSIEKMGSLDNSDLTLSPGVTIWIYSTPADLAATGLAPTDGSLGVPADHLVPLEVAPWTFGKSWEGRNSPVSAPGFVPMPVAYERRWFLAFMRLMWQQIIVRRPHHPDRAERRRWERLAKRKELLDYTVLRLRREVDPNYRPMGPGLPLDHRVVVRGHWKQQFFPSLGEARLPDGTMNPESHRQIWIERHIRGHEFLPLGAEHSATSVVR